MAVIAFPSRTLTPEEEGRLIAAASDIGYLCGRTEPQEDTPMITLLSPCGSLCGAITKRYATYEILDRCGRVLFADRRFERVLDVLTG